MSLQSGAVIRAVKQAQTVCAFGNSPLITALAPVSYAYVMIARCLLAFCAAGCLVAPQRAAPNDLVVHGGWLFDSVHDGVRRNTGIVIRNGVFVAIDSQLKDWSDARVLELGDNEYILPGLFDLHAHYSVDLFGNGSGDGRVDEYIVNPLLFLANGVTSTFTAGEIDPEAMAGARKRIDRGEQIGPRIFNSGPYFGSARLGWNDAEMTAERIRADVRTWAARGIKGLKAKGIHQDQLAALIDEGHRHGLTITGHLGSGFQNTVNPRDAIAMGIDRVEHFMGGDALTPDKPAYNSVATLDATDPKVRAIFKTYIEQHVYFDATVSIYGAVSDRQPKELYERSVDEMDILTPYAREVVKSKVPDRNMLLGRVFSAKLKEVKAFYEAGGGDLITLGTDCASWGEFFCGFAAHRELQALVLAGIPPAAALKIGTINSARALNVGEKQGTIERGRFADLFVVRGNPLEDIRHTRNVRLVIKAGEVYDPAVLLSSAKGKLGPLREEDSKLWRSSGPLKKLK